MTDKVHDRRDVTGQQEREPAVPDLELADGPDTEAVKGGFNPQPDPPHERGGVGQPI